MKGLSALDGFYNFYLVNFFYKERGFTETCCIFFLVFEAGVPVLGDESRKYIWPLVYRS